MTVHCLNGSLSRSLFKQLLTIGKCIIFKTIFMANRNSNYNRDTEHEEGDRERRYRQKIAGQPRNIYGGDTRNYGNANQGGFDRNWWARSRDEVASWLGDEKAKRRLHHEEEGPHRGKGPKGYRRSEERIKEDICERLSDDALLDASDIEVQVSGAEVTLSGQVASRADKRRAEDMAAAVTGVADVHNQLRINR